MVIKVQTTGKKTPIAVVGEALEDLKEETLDIRMQVGGGRTEAAEGWAGAPEWSSAPGVGREASDKPPVAPPTRW